MNTAKPQSYSNEKFDRIAALALFIADCERGNGRAHPQYGYSRDDWARAEETVKYSSNPIR